VCFNKRVVGCKGFKLIQNRSEKPRKHSRILTLLGAVWNSMPVSFDISAATLTSKPFLVFNPCV
jgi:hypothetical protein